MKVQMKDIPKGSALDYCRKLIKNGTDPNTQLEVYRDETLSLIIPKISEGAKWSVQENEKIGPRFRKYKTFHGI